ncbi:MAG: alpha-L-rhamnosidase C-terminal domain-containing protein [Planctomycetota bacterium]
MSEPASFLAHRRSAPWITRAAWPFAWITGTQAPPTVDAFRLNFTSATNEQVRLVVTADEHYRLYLDGKLVRSGPEIGTRWRWQADAIELELSAGTHQLLAIVWSVDKDNGEYAMDGIAHGFALGVDGEANPRFATGTAAWEWHSLPGYTFRKSPLAHWTVPDVHRDASATDWSAEIGQGTGWAPARVGSPVHHQADVEAFPARFVEVGELPAPIHRPWTSFTVRHAEVLQPGIDRNATPLGTNNAALVTQCASMLTGATPLVVPPRTTIRYIIDCDNYVTAWPEFTASGNGATIITEWAESLFVRPAGDPHQDKGNRNDVAGRYAFGIGDRVCCDATSHHWRPLYWRSGRYLILTISTADAAATLSNFMLFEDRYPLEQESTIALAHEGLTRAFPLCLRALQVNAHDLFSDTPYYERMQYIGDTRIDCLVNFVISRNRHLTSKALRMIDSQRVPSGLTTGRCPTRNMQVIPPFSLWYVGMVHDHLWWNGNAALIQDLMPGVRAILEAFLRKRRTDGTIGHIEGWNFTDWTRGFSFGEVLGTKDGSSHASLQVLMALKQVEELETAFGESEFAARCRRQRSELARALTAIFWSEQHGRWADDREHLSFSQHAQALAALCPDLDADKRKRGLSTLRTDPTLAQATIYFTHYLMEAWAATGDEQSIADALAFWSWLPHQGFKALPESPEPSRSDCHAWGAHPIYHTVASIAGIRPAAPGFKRVRVAPCLGAIPSVNVRIPHPDGDWIAATLQTTDGRLRGSITLPAGITGSIVWKQNESTMKPGVNQIAL